MQGKTLKTITTRPCTTSDLDFVWSIYCEAIRPMIEPKLDRPWDDVKEKKNFHAIWNPELSHVVLLESQPIGWGAVDVSDRSVVIDHFYIQEKYRGKGYGTKILEELFAKWRREGKEVYADTIRDSRALSLFARFGMVQHKDESLIKSFVRKP